MWQRAQRATHEATSVRDVRQRETRGSMTTQWCWTNQRITPWPEAATKTLRERVDTAQSTTQWCWRPPTNRRGNESPRPDGVKPDLTNSRRHCCKLRCCGARAPTANQQPRSGADRVVELEVPEANLGAVNYHKGVLEEATEEDREQRQNHSQKSPW